jgi:4-hydroxy-tetrahydrodipicolinate reductase
MIKVSVNGALGKMGSTVCNAVINDLETELIDSVDINSKNHKTPNGKLIHKDFSEIFSSNPPNVIVDFTNRETFINLSTISIPKGINLVSGSTGLLDKDYKAINQLCRTYKV